MDRKLLEEPFDKSLIKTRKAPFGKHFSYVEGAEYIKRLNEAFDGNWSFQVERYQILDNEVVVLGQLEVEGPGGTVTKSAFGGSAIKRTKDDNKEISVADDLKAAATDALKKCCSLLGVGLHLYTDDSPSDSGTSQSTSGELATDKQRNYLTTLAKGEPVWRKIASDKGWNPDKLTKNQASELIERLK